MDEYLNQNLVANRQTETQRTRFTPQGFIALHPNQNPIISLESFYYGTTPAQLVELTEPSAAWFENQQLIIPISQMSLNWSSQGPLAFGGGIPSQQIFTKYTYVSDEYEIVLEDVKGLGLFLEVEKLDQVSDEEVLETKQHIRDFLTTLDIAFGEEQNAGKPELMLRKNGV
jgi:hypothetical protein